MSLCTLNTIKLEKTCNHSDCNLLGMEFFQGQACKPGSYPGYNVRNPYNLWWDVVNTIKDVHSADFFSTIIWAWEKWLFHVRCAFVIFSVKGLENSPDLYRIAPIHFRTFEMLWIACLLCLSIGKFREKTNWKIGVIHIFMLFMWNCKLKCVSFV